MSELQLGAADTAAPSAIPDPVPPRSSAAAERPVLVIGYGNTLRRDDGVGVRAAELMAADPRFAGVEVLTAYQLTPELSLDIATASLVIFVDADVRGLPGAIEVRELEASAGAAGQASAAGPGSAAGAGSEAGAGSAAGPGSSAGVAADHEAVAGEVADREAASAPAGPRGGDPGASSHHVGADEIVALARALSGASPHALAVGIGVADLELGEGLSAPVEAALPRVVDVVARCIADHRSG